ncbi:MAG: lipopolysaccharide biosynthesis protein [Bacteroidales bacterium]
MNKEIVKYLAGRFIPAIVNVAVIILAIRFLGPVEYGKYSLLIYSVVLVITLSFHWVQVSILRFLSGMPKETNIVMSRFFDLTILSALFSTLVVILIGIFYFHLSLMELVLVSLFAFLNHFYLFHQAILHAYHKSVRTAILEGSDQLLMMIVVLVGLFLFHWKSSMLLFSSLVIGLVGVLILRSLTKVKGLLTVDLKHLYWDSRFSAKVVEFGYGIALWLFMSHLMMAMDRFILMEYMGYHEAGMYSALKDFLYKGITFASFPIYISYHAKILDNWNSRHRKDAWISIKEALSFELLIFIIVFIGFMVVKQMLFEEVLRIPEMDVWLVYLPLLLSAFTWQVALLFQRFLELFFRPVYLLAAIGVSVLLNLVLNLIFVPRYGMMASSLILLFTSLIYAGFIVILSFIAGQKLARELP